MRSALKVAGGLAAGGLMLAGFAAPASAADGGGCPDKWNLAPTFMVIESIDNGNWSDQNGDGLACFRVSLGGYKHDSGWVWKDNTNPLPAP